MAYSPAFQFYPKDFLADPNTIRMEPLDIGVYMLLLMECWDRDNRLPKEIGFLAEVCRMTVEEFKPIWEKRVARCFKEKKTFFWHKRIAEEIEKQKEWKAKHSDSGKLGAEKRWASLREKNSFSEKKSENSKEKSAEAKSPENNDLQNSTAMASPSVAMPGHASSSSSSSSFKPNTRAVSNETARAGGTVTFSHPALAAIRMVTKTNPPKPIWNRLCNKLGTDVDIGRLTECFTEWVANGFKEKNYGWAEDWYVNGIPEKVNRNGTGKQTSENGIRGGGRNSTNGSQSRSF
jgi:uncharacterized protein YdaU (DUF1376 family)